MENMDIKNRRLMIQDCRRIIAACRSGEFGDEGPGIIRDEEANLSRLLDPNIETQAEADARRARSGFRADNSGLAEDLGHYSD